MLTQYARELWVKYGVAMAIMVFRFFVRYRIHNGFVFDFTDLWCVVSTTLFSVVTICDFLLTKPEFPTIIGLNAETALLVPDDRIAAYQRGSTIAHFDWVVYICMVFSFKGVMLCVLRKFGEGVKRTEKAVHYTIIFTTCSWMASVIAHFAGCAPIHRVWQVKPFPGQYCAGRPQNYYITGVLNMLCDVIIMAIPMPVLWRLQVSLRRKLALSSLFCSGIFIIVCTILRTYFVLGDSSNQLLGQQWAEREGFVSMIVISAPGIWPIFRQSGLFGSSGRDTGPSRDRNAPRSLFTFRPSRRPPSTDMHRDVDDDCELVPWSDPKDLERRCSFKSEEAKTESHHSLEQENRRMSIIVTKEYDVRYQSGSRPSLPPHPGCQPLG